MSTTADAPLTGSALRRGPGRPRALGHDERIIDAAIEILERGDDVTVTRLVEASGISRAAIYRRWPSMIDLVAAALDRGREPYTIPLEGNLLENVIDTFTGRAEVAGADYSENRLRLRMRLAMTDPKLAQAYWRSHVSRRREGMTAVLREGIRRGELRADIDLDACIDLINGVFYYQLVVRGVSPINRDAAARCREALRVAWEGMAVHSLAAR